MDPKLINNMINVIKTIQALYKNNNLLTSINNK
jgi:hypothetical protein